ncbi:MAG: ABC transporter ATP-binding protein [Anaerolineaceae bacterium]|nr:MAG: ABC transporter ATP-binding protein [Anaerolineaceae bacterium]
MQDRHPLLRLLDYSSRYRRQVVLGTVFSVLNKLFDLAPPALIGGAVDIVTRREEAFLSAFGVTELSAQLWVLAGITLFIWICESVFEYIHKLYWRNLAQNIEHDLRLDAYAHVQDLEMAYFEDQSTGGLMAILNDDVNQLERFLDVGANELIQVTATVVLISAGFMLVAPSVAWMALLPVPIIIYGSVWFQGKLTPRYANVRERVGFLNHQLANNLSGIATIKSFTNEQRETERIRHESDNYRQANRYAIVLSAAFVPLIRMVIVGGFIAIMVFGGQLALSGALNIGLYSVLIFMTQRLLWPLTRLGETFDLYQRAMASTNRIMNLLKTEAQIVDGAQSLPRADVKGHIQFDDVRFAYSNGFNVLKSLSLEIPAGNTAAIVGATGAGKSTVIKLLLRLYDVTGGAVRLDGHDVRDLQLHDLRGAIGLVSQDVFLFHGTVLENILYGRPDATEQEVIAAAKIAEAHDFITSLPQGYATIVGERGQKLSGGQRQRISIARAVLKNPPVLILDEATSAVDNETEAAIQRSMEKLAVGRTTIIIAHRLSTVRAADQIFVLSEGELHEHGTHAELAAQDGIYAALWRVQTGEKLKAAGD